jgi:hypothetical protein
VVDIELCFTSATEIARRIAAGELSPTEVTANALERIEEVNPILNAFCSIYADEAMAEAEAHEAVAGRLSDRCTASIALKGSMKDIHTLGSYAYEHWIPDDAAIVVALPERVHRGQRDHAAGFAHSSFTESLCSASPAIRGIVPRAGRLVRQPV